jgi:rubrerythrin
MGMTREEAIKRIQSLAFDVRWEHSYKQEEEALRMAIEALKEPERKYGKWVECQRVGPQFHPDYPSVYSVFICTSCLQANDRKEKYCPHCGAEMEN